MLSLSCAALSYGNLFNSIVDFLFLFSLGSDVFQVKTYKHAIIAVPDMEDMMTYYGRM